MTDTLNEPVASTPAEAIPVTPSPVTDAAASPAAPAEKRARPARPNVLPVLEKLATLYPHLFGAVFRPLKRGIFQDLQDAQPDTFEKQALKDALSGTSIQAASGPAGGEAAARPGTRPSPVAVIVPSALSTCIAIDTPKP